jgi:hypothetical protein
LAFGVADAEAFGGRVVDTPRRCECAVIGHSLLENEQGTRVNWCVSHAWQPSHNQP